MNIRYFALFSPALVVAFSPATNLPHTCSRIADLRAEPIAVSPRLSSALKSTSSSSEACVDELCLMPPPGKPPNTSPTSEPSILPPDWSREVDKETGYVFYYNARKAVTQWEVPEWRVQTAKKKKFFGEAAKAIPLLAPLAPAVPAVVSAVVEQTRVWWLEDDATYPEASRQYRRTVYMHDEWVKHRSSDRFIRNLQTLGESGVNQALSTELKYVTYTAGFCVLINMLLFSYQDLSGLSHPGPLNFLDVNLKAICLPALPFSILMPALSLLLVFRTNTAYSRWNEARTLWGSIINNCRNVVRQSNTFFPRDEKHAELKRRMAADTAGFCRALRNFLRGPSDDATLRAELGEMVVAGVMTQMQADACMNASNRPMFMLSAMSEKLRMTELDPIDRSRIDTSISVLVDLTGANERIFKSPVPLVYTRHTARFLSIFLLLLPFGLWSSLGDTWNHWATVPVTDVIAFFLFGIEEIGIQIEEPFSVLPIESFCNGAISATNDEMMSAVDQEVFRF